MELIDIVGVHCINVIPRMFNTARIDFTVPLSRVRGKPQPSPGLHLSLRTLAPPSPPSESPYHRWELSIVPLRLIIYSNRVGLEPNLPLTRLLTPEPQTVCNLFAFFMQRLESLMLHS
jgi:hypothetical protein